MNINKIEKTKENLNIVLEKITDRLNNKIYNINLSEISFLEKLQMDILDIIKEIIDLKDDLKKIY